MTGPVLVTGAAGRVGARIAELLRDRGVAVRALVHRAEPAVRVDEVVHGDLRDGATLHAAVAGTAGVVHAAARKHSRSPHGYEAVNVEGVRLLVGAAAAAGVPRFVHVGTTWIDESGGAYSRSKAAGEAVVRAASLPATIVRLPELYGADGDDGLDRIIALAAAGRRVPLIGRGDQEIRPIHVDEAAAAVVAALANPDTAGRTYTLAGTPTTVRAFAERCQRQAGHEPRLLEIPTVLVRALALAARVVPLPLYPDQLSGLTAPKPPPSAEAEADLGFRPAPSAGIT